MDATVVGVETTGLPSAEAARRLAAAGPNTLPAERRPSTVLLGVRQLTHFFAIVLWVAAGLAALAGMPHLAAAIVVVIVINGGFAFVQEYRADRAADRLRDLLPVTARVRRDGRVQTIPAAELVTGDVVQLEAGDRVSADLLLIRESGLAIEESLLTGESVPRRVGQRDTAYAGTFVVEGAGTAQVTATGAGTRLAAIAALTRRTRRPPSPLAIRLNRVVRQVAIIAVAVGTVFFALSVLLGVHPVQGFLFALGVTVALIPEGLLPTVTLSLAWGARTMAQRKALVKRLESVETLGSVTFICTDKTGTLTRNEMNAVEVWTPAGTATITGDGYSPTGEITPTDADTRRAVGELAYAAVRSSTGRLVERHGVRHPSGDPMEVALHVLALRTGVPVAEREAAEPATARYPFDSRRLRASTLVDDTLYVKGAPEAVLSRCRLSDGEVEIAHEMAARGLRVLAVAIRRGGRLGAGPDQDERDLALLGIVGLEDPPRPDVREAVASCHRAGIGLAMITGDHGGTASAVAREVGLDRGDGLVIQGADLPADDDALGALLDRDGVVVCRVSPEDKLRIAHALQRRGHVVAMTGDGVNDAPALREADIGVAMGKSGSDVAREAADLVLLDDHFATIIAAVEQGRATFANIRRFLTYHLTDNVAELAPFVVWAITGGSFPLAIGVLQVLALDIGTDLLPALALGAEPPSRTVLAGPARTGQLLDRPVLTRAFGILGPTEVVVSLGAFTAVLLAGGWRWATAPPPELLATASGTAFAAIVLGQLANAFACRSENRPAFALDPRRNRLLLGAVSVELAMLAAFVGVPPIASALGGSWPTALGWTLAAAAVPAVIAIDALAKVVRRRWMRAVRPSPRTARWRTVDRDG